MLDPGDNDDDGLLLLLLLLLAGPADYVLSDCDGAKSISAKILAPLFLVPPDNARQTDACILEQLIRLPAR